jgi:hypothetical protein
MSDLFDNLGELNFFLKKEKKKLLERDEMSKLPSIIFNKHFVREKPGPKINILERGKKIRILSVKLNCPETIKIVADALIKHWFHGYHLFYVNSYSEDHRIPIPHWYISSAGPLDRPSITGAHFKFKTDFKKGRPINPRLFIGINFTDSINPWSEFDEITIDEAVRQILLIYKRVYGEFASKKGIKIIS